MLPIEMTREPVQGYSGTIHFGVPQESGLRVSRVTANSYGDARPFVTVEFIDNLGLEFIFDRDSVPEAEKRVPDIRVLRSEIEAAICANMTPPRFKAILAQVSRKLATAREEGKYELQEQLRKLLGI